MPAALGDLTPYVHVAAGGASLKFQLASEPADPRLIYVEPAAGEIWPSGTTVEVTVDGALPDRFGATLGQPVSTTFLPCRTTGDKGSACLPPPDGGAPGGDAAAPDGGAGGDDAADAAAAID